MSGKKKLGFSSKPKGTIQVFFVSPRDWDHRIPLPPRSSRQARKPTWTGRLAPFPLQTSLVSEQVSGNAQNRCLRKIRSGCSSQRKSTESILRKWWKCSRRKLFTHYVPIDIPTFHTVCNECLLQDLRQASQSIWHSPGHSTHWRWIFQGLLSSIWPVLNTQASC